MSQTRLVSRSTTLWWLALPLLWTSACQPLAEGAAPAADPSLPEHRFDAGECRALSGVARTLEAASEGVAAIAYELARDEGLIRLEARAPDGSVLGNATITHEVRTGVAIELWTDLRYAEGGEEARQTTRGVVTGDVVRHTTEHELGGLRSTLWWTSTLAGELRSATMGVRVEDASGAGDGIRRLPEGTYRTLELVAEGVQVADDATIAAFVSANGLRVFENSVAYRRLEAITDDSGWRAVVTARADACAAGAARAHEADLGLGSANEAAAALTCEKTLDVLGKVLNAEGAVGTARNAAAITLALGAAGVVTTATGAAVVFVGTAVVLYAAGKAIDNAVSARGGELISAPLVLAGNDDDASAVSAFFRQKGSSKGDPHLTTHDGQAYDFQSAGDFILTRSASGDFEVQVRQLPWESALCPDVAFNRALAFRLGPHRIGYDPEATPRLTLDGVPVDTVDGALLLEGGAGVYALAGRRWLFVAPTGESVLVDGEVQLNLSIDLPAARAGAYEGLLGNFDGLVANDLVGSAGVLPDPASFADIHGALAERWAVDEDTSLFDYAEGEGPETYRDPGFPAAPLRVDSVPADARASAEAACAEVANPIAFEDCVLDVGCTGDIDIVATHVARDPPLRAPILSPIPLTQWTQAGPAANGTWLVAPDGQSVMQTAVNNGPTFFLSPDTYLGVRLDATLGTLPTGDRDIIGLAFGLSSPGSTERPSSSSIHGFVVTWKAEEEQGAPEGLRLLHVHGDLQAEGAEALFWRADAPGAVEVLAEDVGPGTGWGERPTRVSLLYTSERIEVWLDGAVRLSLDAADTSWPFSAGRFGFFNHSQTHARYADVTLAPPTPAPVRARCTLVLDRPLANTVVGDTVFGNTCTRYEVSSRDLVIEEGGTLRIAPGTEIAFGEDVALSVKRGATLVAAGSAEAPIRLVGLEANKGVWGGISIHSDGAANRLGHVELAHAGGLGFQGGRAAVTVTGDSYALGRVAIDDCRFHTLGDKGVVVWEGGLLESFARNRFDEVDGIPLEVPARMAERVSSDNTFAGMQMSEPVVRIIRGESAATELLASATWQVLDVPWRIASRPRIGAVDAILTLPPGSRLLFEEQAALDAATGAIFAVGTAERPILFDGVEGTPGSWAGLFVRSDLEMNMLDHVDIAHAGGMGFQFERTALVVTGEGTTPGRVTLRNSTIRGSAGTAVVVRRGGTFQEENNQYSDNAEGDVVTR